ncbi:MAG: capsule assembly Wzi family protein [Longimicrobiales bacterium]
MKTTMLCAAALLAAALTSNAAHAQQPPPCDTLALLPAAGVHDPLRDFARTAQLMGQAPLRPRLFERASAEPSPALCAGALAPWARRAAPQPAEGAAALELLPVGVRGALNSSYPVDRNNGVLWGGVGSGIVLEGGATLRWGPLSLAAAPIVAYQQNTSFETLPVELPGSSPFAHAWYPLGIDWPQRFGSSGFTTLSPGQSYVRLDHRGAALGFATENLWWGPARRYPILMSNTAGGFPHAFIGTSRPLDIGIGRLAAELVWGHLGESDFFDDDRANDRTLFAGALLAFEPAPLPGLFLGAARAHLSRIPPGGLALGDYISVPYFDPLENPRDTATANNQLFSLFFRWAHAPSGFEAYAEWAREDNFDGWRDLLFEPDHSQGYMLGLQKVLDYGRSWYRLAAELIHLESSITHRSGRGIVSFYTHGRIGQGYTHRGQLLGAAIGPGSGAQFLALDRFDPGGSLGVFIERVRHNTDTYHSVWSQWFANTAHDVEVTGGINALRTLADFELFGELALSHRQHRNFIGLHPGDPRFISENNLHLEVGGRWWP